MHRKQLPGCWAAALLLATTALLAPRGAHAQQVGVNGPFQNAGHRFYENIGVRWGVQGRGWFFNFGGPTPQPSLGVGNANGFFQLSAAQGSDTFIGSQSPSVTVMNGGSGFFSDTTQRPFVTGLIPVVGASEPVSPVRERLTRLQNGELPAAAQGGNSVAPGMNAGTRSVAVSGSSAERGDVSVAEIKAAQAAEAAAQRSELNALVEKARQAEAAGKFTSARLYYQMAARRTTGEEQSALSERARRLETR